MRIKILSILIHTFCLLLSLLCCAWIYWIGSFMLYPMIPGVIVIVVQTFKSILKDKDSFGSKLEF
jgi:hypothetical protein